MPEPNKLELEKQTALRCWYVVGATASGKSDAGIELALRLNAEIISLDSMAIYRGMDVGTAKPTRAQQQRVPHHLIDIEDPDETFSVSRYRELALRTIAEITARGRNVVFVGGTALYLKAMLRGIFEGPPADWAFRHEIEEEIQRAGLAALHRRLAQVDPLSAHKLHPQDKRRMIRALEVLKATGIPISHWQQEFEYGVPAAQCRVFAIRHPRDVLHQRIEARVEQMLAEGLVAECEALRSRPKPLSRTALQAVGYREVLEHLSGEIDKSTMVERIKVRTRRFARHQETWFRNLTECRMVDFGGEVTAREIADRLLREGTQVDLASTRG